MTLEILRVQLTTPKQGPDEVVLWVRSVTGHETDLAVEVPAGTGLQFCRDLGVSEITLIAPEQVKHSRTGRVRDILTPRAHSLR